ncbi:hypothetical protein [Burkholderia cepacia]|uniref:hypothetical protein n=1 Tax=Burkholderia cepacia TaxID=292 RepID=UPI00249F7B1C|nr:hypothetical protein [Burkholderia cepacia]
MIEFAGGSGATATPSHVDDGTLEVAVDKYVTQKRHKITARRWLLRPADTTRRAWRVAEKLPVT